MIQYIRDKYKIKVIETPKNQPAICDGIMIKNNDLIGIFESKCRYNINYNDIKKMGSWLVTYKKIDECAWLSSKLRVPFYGILYLKSDPTILRWKITDNTGSYLFDFEVKQTRTQRSINGGKAVRENAFLPTKYAMVI